MRCRGRPCIKNQSDDVIGKTAQKLIMLGFPRRKVYDELCVPAANILNRTDSYNKSLSSDRIEQIHENWVAETKNKLIQSKGYYIPFQRWRYKKFSLQSRRLKIPINDLIKLLLKNKGNWPEKNIPGIYIDWELAPKAEKELMLMPRCVLK
ncbi:MAG: hypothetical protein A2W76_05305 [Gammaproteobacteria bacterium RIFCSPLOWO2_12_47_11]|nr:MAG: hypothetical protein A2W76_05305 [Gammaproteobacteria bacterium RIFCSPLOWO2_12_47_11]